MSYEVNWEARGVMVRIFGNSRGRDLINAYNAVNKDERFDDARYEIVDCSDITESSISIEDMRQIAHLDRAAARSVPNLRLAIVSPHENTQALAHFYKSEADDISWDIGIFSDLDTTRKWCDPDYIIRDKDDYIDQFNSDQAITSLR